MKAAQLLLGRHRRRECLERGFPNTRIHKEPSPLYRADDVRNVEVVGSSPITSTLIRAVTHAFRSEREVEDQLHAVGVQLGSSRGMAGVAAAVPITDSD